MKRPEPELNAHEYCQKHGLRILAPHAFDFFYEEIGKHPGNYLEIGCFEGYMIRELAKAYPKKQFYAIDPFVEDGHTVGHQNYAKPGQVMLKQQQIAFENALSVPNVAIYDKASTAFAKCSNEVLAALNVSCVFVDGNHSYEHVDNDCRLAVRLLPKSGVIFFDDINDPEVSRAVKEFVDREASRISARKSDNSILRIDAINGVLPEHII